MKTIILVLLIALMGMGFASTVTLTGTCYSNIVNQTDNYILFNLTNSGNGTATNMLLVPSIQGATPLNASIPIQLVAPSNTYSSKFYLSNFTTPGSYLERFIARYSQGASSFETFFPCIVNINRSTHSLIAIESSKISGKIVRVNLSSIASYPINAQVSVYAPPSFSVNSSVQNVTLKPYSFANVSFTLSTPQYTNAEFPVAISVSYMNDSLHYAALAVTAISFGNGSTSALSSILQGNLIFAIIGAIVAIILVLIAISIIKQKKRSA